MHQTEALQLRHGQVQEHPVIGSPSPEHPGPLPPVALDGAGSHGIGKLPGQHPPGSPGQEVDEALLPEPPPGFRVPHPKFSDGLVHGQDVGVADGAAVLAAECAHAGFYSESP